jgi:hypothetical protein
VLVGNCSTACGTGTQPYVRKCTGCAKGCVGGYTKIEPCASMPGVLLDN